MSKPIEGDFVRYAGIGAMTPAVAGALLGRIPEYQEGMILDHEIRMLMPEQMSEEERDIMGNEPRFVPVPRKGIGIKGFLYTVKRKELGPLEDFDNSEPSIYRRRVVQIQTETGLTSAFLVVRPKGGPQGEQRDPQNYDPYEAFSDNPMVGEYKVLEIARRLRAEAIRNF